MLLNIIHPKYLPLTLTTHKPCILNGLGKSIYLHQIADILPCHDLQLIWKFSDDSAHKSITLLTDCYPRLWLAVSVGAEIGYGAPNVDVAQLLAQWEIANLSATLPVHNLNRWQSLCVSLAAMEAAMPRLVLLDQPLAGLTTQNASRMRNMLRAWQQRNLHAMLIADNRPEEWSTNSDNNATDFWQLTHII